MLPKNLSTLGFKLCYALFLSCMTTSRSNSLTGCSGSCLEPSKETTLWPLSLSTKRRSLFYKETTQGVFLWRWPFRSLKLPTSQSLHLGPKGQISPSNANRHFFLVFSFWGVELPVPKVREKDVPIDYLSSSQKWLFLFEKLKNGLNCWLYVQYERLKIDI